MSPNKPPAMYSGDETASVVIVISITWPDAYGRKSVIEDVTTNVAADAPISGHSGFENWNSLVTESRFSLAIATRLLSIVSFLLWAIDPFPSSHTHTQTQALVALGSKALRALRAPEVPAMIQSTPLPSPPLPFEPGPRSSPHRRGCSDVREPAQCRDVVPGQAVDLGQQRPRANGSGHQARHSPA